MVRKNTPWDMIPKDWDVVVLGEYSEISRGGSPRPIQDYLTPNCHGINWIKIGDVSKNSKYIFSTAEKIIPEGVSKSRCVFRGDLILSNSMSFGRPYILKIDGCIHDGWLVIQNYQSAFDKEYLYYCLGSKFTIQQYISMAAGSSVQNLNKDKVSAVIIAKPPIQEQTAIAEALSDVDSLISSLQKLIEKKKAIKQGTMQELLTGKKRLPGFSMEWSQATFGDLFDFLPTNAFTRDQMTDTGTIQNVHYGDILTKYGACLDMANTDVPYLLETVSVRKYSESSYVREGDVIIADTAEDSTVGKCVELVNVHGKVLSGQHTMLCRPKVTFAPKFLGYYMNAECFHNQMLPFITGIKVSSISKANISTLVLKYPTLVEEQQAIAQVFSDMDNEIAQLEKKLAKYQQIKQGMMQELLTGRIRLVDADRKEQPKTQILQEKQPAHNQHFDDAVMIAGIVNAFYSEKYPLGRKKVQKLLYLVRRKEQADISAFHKKAAGPYADEVRYKGGEPIAQKNKYIQVKRNEKGSRFEKGVQMQQALTYLQDWGKQGDVDWLVSQFQYTSVNELELLATVDMAICDLRREGKEISVASIKDLIRSNKEWIDKLKKTYFRDSDIQRAIKKCEDLFES